MARRQLVVEADGGSRGNPGPAGYGALVRDAVTGEVLAERADHLGVASNNVAEYSGLVAGLRVAMEIDPQARVEVRMDSRLVVEQMSGRWQIKHEDMRRLAAEARAVAPAGQVRYTWVPRAENSAADALANEAMDHRVPVVRGPGAGRTAADDGSGSDLTPDQPQHRAQDQAQGAVAGSAATGTPDRPAAAEPLTVILVRHGETPMTVTRAYSGSSVVGPSLTERGRQQATRAAALVESVTEDEWGDVPPTSEVLASPMTRTQETAAAIAERLGLPVRTEPLVAECDFGEWEGLTAAQIDERWPGELERWHEDASVRAPGGESIEDVGGRMRTALELLRAGGVGRTVVVVTHSVSVRSAVGVAIGANSSAWARIRVAPASVSIIRMWSDGKNEVTVVGAPSGA
ncbi:bifunctional RNase H/acid phosphatase [uncultured Cellulomonas sp.]|uniref:bifunctional RNase H/acid phosphatase n=1 Tax=uncultured Cellulomonas sp. TaxID=189682 RepID=UPI00260395F3|nr:bifunctional RNase H/acid phosphatase [uncultured Cellulomonas sp.]